MPGTPYQLSFFIMTLWPQWRSHQALAIIFSSASSLQNEYQEELPDCLFMESLAKCVDCAVLCWDCETLQNWADLAICSFVGGAEKLPQIMPLVRGSSSKASNAEKEGSSISINKILRQEPPPPRGEVFESSVRTRTAALWASFYLAILFTETYVPCRCPFR